MSGLVEKLRAWIKPRWNGPEQIAAFVSKPLPRNVSWPHTLGSLLLVYIVFQALTGILLGFYYSPSPESAYASLRYVREDLVLGQFIYRLHQFGAGFIMVTAFLHMARSYFFAAYKSPRELLWISGLLLGVLLTLFAFTGQLLPYDQRGYWATVVGIQIASGVPVVGDSIRELLTGGYGNIGAATLSRFYILHVCVLPLALVGLTCIHLGILQRTGSAGPMRGLPQPLKPFYPTQAVKDVLVAAIGALALFIVAGLVGVEDTGPANPAAGDFTPRPEWYFLSHYQILKYLPGKWQVVGTFVLPNALLALLIGLPFVDRRPERSLRRRPLAMIAGSALCLAIVGLTAMGIAGGPASGPEAGSAKSSHDPIEHGRKLFLEMKCIQCHRVGPEGPEGGDKGPDLTHIARRMRADFLPDWIRNPRNLDPTTEMPSFEGTEDELDAVVEYLLTLK